ncbi:hypothetical protein QAD02_012838 [Eretmocerus hayati]|uniref:Uncharacterized protein n=1 Tax=Eretmocerus hayati TaxID=131215 RepID=A0ACC2P2L5_9HYME|nr:hypothetical protein QAD02_012838 [Eretmocerus hayati]
MKENVTRQRSGRNALHLKNRTSEARHAASLREHTRNFVGFRVNQRPRHSGAAVLYNPTTQTPAACLVEREIPRNPDNVLERGTQTLPGTLRKFNDVEGETQAAEEQHQGSFSQLTNQQEDRSHTHTHTQQPSSHPVENSFEIFDEELWREFELPWEHEDIPTEIPTTLSAAERESGARDQGVQHPTAISESSGRQEDRTHPQTQRQQAIGQTVNEFLVMKFP